MATSFEVRVPMLDHEFLGWVAALPVDWKFRAGTRKCILKKLAARLGIPRELLHRPKQGFQLPFGGVDPQRNEGPVPARSARAAIVVARIFQAGGRAVGGRRMSAGVGIVLGCCGECWCWHSGTGTSWRLDPTGASRGGLLTYSLASPGGFRVQWTPCRCGRKPGTGGLRDVCDEEDHASGVE